MIYILEDDDNIRKLINYSLKNQGFEVQDFALPSAFWKALENHKSDLLLLDIMLPVIPSENITTHIAMLHTIFNICATALFVPFVNQIASISRKVIPETKAEKDGHYHLPAILPHSRISADLYSYQIQAEISKMSAKVMEMFDSVCNSFMNPKMQQLKMIMLNFWKILVMKPVH